MNTFTRKRRKEADKIVDAFKIEESPKKSNEAIEISISPLEKITMSFINLF